MFLFFSPSLQKENLNPANNTSMRTHESEQNKRKPELAAKGLHVSIQNCYSGFYLCSLVVVGVPAGASWSFLAMEHPGGLPLSHSTAENWNQNISLFSEQFYTSPRKFSQGAVPFCQMYYDTGKQT